MDKCGKRYISLFDFWLIPVRPELVEGLLITSLNSKEPFDKLRVGGTGLLKFD